MNECLLIKLPRYVLLGVIKDFFEIESIGRLDAALGSAASRRVLHENMQSCSAVFKNDTALAYDLSIVSWLFLRHIQAEKLCVKLDNSVSGMTSADPYTFLSCLDTLSFECAAVAKPKHQVQTLFTKICNYYFKPSSNKVQLYNIITQMSSACSASLTSLEVSHLPYSLDSALAALSETVRGLRMLRLRECKKLTTAALLPIVQNNARLESVSLVNNCSLSGRVVIDVILADYLRDSLQSLHLTFNGFDATFVTQALENLFACCTRLSSLVTNSWDSLINAHHYTSLTSLLIEYSSSNYVMYHSVPTWNSPTHLLSITIDVTATTDITVYYVARSHSQLTALRILNSEFVSLISVQDVTRYCRALQHLGLVNCQLLASDAIYTLANKRLACLTSLDISWNSRINTDSLTHLLSSCKGLRDLCVVGCGEVSVEQLLSLPCVCSYEGSSNQCKLIY